MSPEDALDTTGKVPSPPSGGDTELDKVTNILERLSAVGWM